MGRSWRIGIEPGPTALVTRGLYRRLRSPIYSVLLSALLGVVVLAPVWWVMGAWLVCLGLVAIQARREEAHMARLHPQAFAEWATHTGRFLPGLGSLRKGG